MRPIVEDLERVRSARVLQPCALVTSRSRSLRAPSSPCSNEPAARCTPARRHRFLRRSRSARSPREPLVELAAHAAPSRYFRQAPPASSVRDGREHAISVSGSRAGLAAASRARSASIVRSAALKSVRRSDIRPFPAICRSSQYDVLPACHVSRHPGVRRSWHRLSPRAGPSARREPLRGSWHRLRSACPREASR